MGQPTCGVSRSRNGAAVVTMISYKSTPAQDVGNATGSTAAGVGVGISPPAQDQDDRTQSYQGQSLSCIATRRWSA
jgi:hypothetical protein